MGQRNVAPIAADEPAALRATPCVLLTASEDRGAELRALDAGADAFVRKDDLEVVLARISAVLRGTSVEPVQAASLVGPKRILAVDDSATYLHELLAVLRGEGYEVVPARSGEEGLEMLAAQSFDCILLDLVMPGIDGTETCRRIKSSQVLRDIPLIMLTAAEDRRAIVLKLRTFSRLDEGERKSVSVRECVESLLTILGHHLKDRIEVQTRYGEPDLLECYPSLLTQAIMNLVANAIDAIRERGTIVISTGADGDAYRISVADTGSGIPEELRERILDPFFTTKPVGQGTGLGLSISYSIVRKHGGALEFGRAAGGGTEAVIRVPIANAGAARSKD